MLEVDEFRAEAKQLDGVIDETVADRLDTIIDRNHSVRTVSTPKEMSVACSKSRPKSPATDRPLSKRSSAFRRYSEYSECVPGGEQLPECTFQRSPDE